MTIEEWLAACPLPVVARVVSDTESIRHLAISSCLYDESMLVVIGIEGLSQFYSELEVERSEDTFEECLTEEEKRTIAGGR